MSKDFRRKVSSQRLKGFLEKFSKVAFKLTSTILGVGHEYLELFLDLISQSPFRLFSWSTPNPKIVLKIWYIKQKI